LPGLIVGDGVAGKWQVLATDLVEVVHKMDGWQVAGVSNGIEY
jgi:hypothetical protein